MSRSAFRHLLWSLVFSLCSVAGCGGSDGGASTSADSSAPTIDAQGGTVRDTSGASVVVPAGAVSTPTTIRIAADSTDAPPLPASTAQAGPIYVITPHGTTFAQAVEVSIPMPTTALRPNQQFMLAKAEPGGDWQLLGDTSVQAGMLTTRVNDFSFFVPVVITYPVPMVQAAPLALASISLDCGTQDCGAFAQAPSDVTLNFTTRAGQIPADCAAPALVAYSITNGANRSAPLPLTGGSARLTLSPADFRGGDAWIAAGLLCGATTAQIVRGFPQQDSANDLSSRRVRELNGPAYPAIRIVSAPARLDVVAGSAAALRIVVSKVAPATNSSYQVIPSDPASVQWQRSIDGGFSWQPVGRSLQTDSPSADGSNTLGHNPWPTWYAQYGFVASASDAGSLIRGVACYTPPADDRVPKPSPCSIGPSTQINVLQQSDLPSISQSPASMLVTTGQTASLSATAAGLPAPTLRWQTRAADAATWVDVASGSGADSAHFTTAPLTLADNGRQYRVVATNALGTAQSAAAVVSVSDAAVAPSINASPSDLSVGAGSDAVFAVDATGTAALSYQWSFNGQPIAGANGATLKLLAVTTAQAGSYRVTVTNAIGQATSSAAVLSVTAGPATPAAPAILVQPSAAQVSSGATASFSVTAGGSSDLHYQWLRNNVAITGATGPSYTTPSLAVSDSGAVYAVVVYNGAGIVFSQGAVLSVSAPAPSLAASPDGKLSALNAHACAIGADAHVYCWGNGVNGELGNEFAATSSVPVQVSGVSNATFVSAGGTGSCAIANQGTLSCWGAVAPTMNLGPTPVAIEGITGASWVAVGTDHVCYVDASARVLCWGDNSAGQLGDGTTTSRSTPVIVLGNGAPLSGIVSVSAGSRFTCAVRDTGEAYCWGADTAGQARTTAQRLQVQTGSQTSDFSASGPIAAGLHHACALNMNSLATACWGSNNGGQLGDGTFNSGDVAADILSYGRSRFAGGSSHTCALGNLDVVCWGTAAMGNGNAPQTLTSPQAAGKVASLSLQAHTVNAIAAGDRFTCALRTSGDVQCWGLNNAGQTGIGSTSDTSLILTPASTTRGPVFWTP